MTEPAADKSTGHRTVSRVTGILEFVARSGRSVRLSEIVVELDAPRSSVHGLVHGLVSTGYLRATDDGRYSLGPALGALVMRRTEADHSIRAEMESLSLEFDETVTLVALAGDSMVTIDAIESARVVRYNPIIGARRPLYPTSAGLCFLAFANAGYRDMYLERNFPLDSERDRVRRELKQVRAHGYAVNNGNPIPDLHGVSAPIFDGRSVTGVVTVAGPTTRFSERADDITRAVCAAVTRLSSGDTRE